ncbi:MAG TPA: MarR family transcriptional regulator [Saprospiraceae bacterium]|nr:MarR family transcriptional regulator [Saprospiraceae bacterium]HMP22638.1 MarR family transcriptional regulator [Saprospiraceae bacterium]
MKIEEAIRQKKPFRNPYQKAVVNLIFTTNWLTDHIRTHLKPFGITMQQYNVLRILRGAGKPISTSDIRDRLLDKMADTSRMVDRLCQKGLVIRSVCPGDKRLVDVTLSDAGEALLAKLDQQDDAMDKALQRLSETEAEQLSALLDKIRG